MLGALAYTVNEGKSSESKKHDIFLHLYVLSENLRIGKKKKFMKLRVGKK